MTPGQRLAIGFAIGGVIALLIHPGSRGHLLYAFGHSDIELAAAGNPIKEEPFTLPHPGNGKEMSQYDRFATAHALTRILNRKEQIMERDLELARNFLAESEALDPDNAYWPQLSAALEARFGGREEAERHWQRATTRLAWASGVSQQVDRLWTNIEHTEGIRLAWQGLYALSFRQGDPALFISTSTRRLMQPTIESRYAAVLNAGLMLAGSTSLDGGRMAVSALQHASLFGAPPGTLADPREVERRRAEFVQHVADGISPEAAQRARRELLRAEGWHSLIVPEPEIAEQRATAHVSAVLTATAPSAVFAASMIMAMIGLLGLAVASAFAAVPHPDSRIFYALGVVGGLVLFIMTGAWLLALWCVALGVLLGLPMRVAKLDPVESGPIRPSILALIGVCCLALTALYFGSNAPPATYLASGAERPPFDAVPWAALAFIGVTLTIPYSVIWARARSRSPVLTAGEAVARLGLAAAIIGVFATVLITPAAIWEDSRNRHKIERWVHNEPKAFEVPTP